MIRNHGTDLVDTIIQTNPPKTVDEAKKIINEWVEQTHEKYDILKLKGFCKIAVSRNYKKYKLVCVDDDLTLIIIT